MERNKAIDIARAISMFYIIGFWHLFGYTEMVNRFPYGEYLKNATLATFIFISGYLLGHKYAIDNFKSLGKFLKSRIFRLIPLFAIALFSYFIVGFISFRTALLAFSGFSTLFPPQPPTLWFVSMILIFYYLFPLISSRKIIAQVIIITIVFVSIMLLDRLYGGVDRRFFYYWPCFAVGVILSRYSINSFVKSWRTIVLALSVFSAVSILHYFELVSLPEWLYRLMIALAGVFVIISLSQVAARSQFMVKVCSILSYLSMAAYLFHRQIIDIVEKYIYWPQDGLIRIIYLILVCLPVVLLIGYIIQRLYDKLLDYLLPISRNFSIKHK